jgi:uncharacterized membrane protein YhiD involved in acid resistance
MAVGAGYYSAAAISTVLVIISLWPLRIVARRVFVRFRPERERLVVDLERSAPPGSVLDAVEAAGGRVESLVVADEGERRSVAMEVDFPGRSREAVVTQVASVSGVTAVRWGQ